MDGWIWPITIDSMRHLEREKTTLPCKNIWWLSRKKSLYIDHFIWYLHLMMCSQFSCQISGKTQASRNEQKIMRNLVDKKRTNVNEKIAGIKEKQLKVKVNESTNNEKVDLSLRWLFFPGPLRCLPDHQLLQNQTYESFSISLLLMSSVFWQHQSLATICCSSISCLSPQCYIFFFQLYIFCPQCNICCFQSQ